MLIACSVHDIVIVSSHTANVATAQRSLRHGHQLARGESECHLAFGVRINYIALPSAPEGYFVIFSGGT